MHRPARVVRFTAEAAAVDLAERYDALRTGGSQCIAQRIASGCRIHADRLCGDGGILHSLLEAAYANHIDELAAGTERYRLFRANHQTASVIPPEQPKYRLEVLHHVELFAHIAGRQQFAGAGSISGVPTHSID